LSRPTPDEHPACVEPAVDVDARHEQKVGIHDGCPSLHLAFLDAAELQRVVLDGSVIGH
jgi:hypothetical protein